MSLHVFASTDNFPTTQVIQNLQLRREGDQLVVHTTDRYCLARGIYDVDTDHSKAPDEAELVEVYLNAKTAKSFLPMVKKVGPNAMVVIDDETITVKANPDIVIPLETITSSYPAVDKLIPEDVHAAPAQPSGMVSFRPDFVAKLSKVILPTMAKQDRNQPWIFSIAETRKPIICRPVVCGDQIVVLIQPNITPTN
jgi:hypothetical protein